MSCVFGEYEVMIGCFISYIFVINQNYFIYLHKLKCIL